jgi:hypothetical protein
MAYDFIAHHRRAVAGGFAVLAVLAGAWLWWAQRDPDPVVGETSVQGTVRAVAGAGGAAGTTGWQVELPDGRRVVVDLGRTPRRDGDAVTLQAYRHASGKVVYFLPREAR